MSTWTEQEARAFFESGGADKPVKRASAVEAAPDLLFPIQQPLDSPRGKRDLPRLNRVKLFGDSHTNSFISVECKPMPLLAYPFTAGSAMGLRHADSITGYRKALEGDLLGTKPADAIVLKFGQVDCDFVYFLKLVDQPSLSFEDFARDSVRKYFTFVDDCLASLPLRREQLIIMTPFATCVPDAHLRESLCTLPFMQPEFKRQFRVKLDALRTLPSLDERTRNGARYAQLLREAADERALRTIDMHTPLLGGGPSGGVNRLINADQNHHLVDEHIPMLLQALDAAFGGPHRMAISPPATSMPPAAAASAGQPMKESDAQAAMAWVEAFQALRSGRVLLKLAGHAVCSYRTVHARFGPPLPMQFSTPRNGSVGFATWLVQFPAAEGDAPSATATDPQLPIARILGRYRNYDDEHAWLVECSTPTLIDCVRTVLEAPSDQRRPGAAAARSGIAYEVPPPAFHQVLSGRR